jgi:hypothetical protein
MKYIIIHSYFKICTYINETLDVNLTLNLNLIKWIKNQLELATKRQMLNYKNEVLLQV